MLINVDYSKYKRFFVFGCSFTSYIWPTWADILSREMPQAEYYNFGRAGGGNLFISSRLAEANVKFKFCETDFVAVMYTTFTREDRWVNGNWLCLGNIYNQSKYPMEWVYNFADEVGYTIRDLSLLELSSDYVRNLPCLSLLMSARPLEKSHEGPYADIDLKNFTDLYKNLNEKIITIYNLEEDVINLKTGFDYEMNGENFHDGHPRPIQYYEYLKKIGINLTDRSKDYVYERENKLLSCNTYDEIKSEMHKKLMIPPIQLF